MRPRCSGLSGPRRGESSGTRWAPPPGGAACPVTWGHKVSTQPRSGAQHRIQCSPLAAEASVGGGVRLRRRRFSISGKNRREGSLGVNGKDIAVSVDCVQGQVSSCQLPGTLCPLSAKNASASHSLDFSTWVVEHLRKSNIHSTQFHSLLPSVIPSYLHNCKHFFKCAFN